MCPNLLSLNKSQAMPILFRKIRKALLSGNSATKYILYAIGEIVLVVIGILIALQINNYSEEIKKREIESVLLNNLFLEVDLDIRQITENTEQSLTRLAMLDSVIKKLKHPETIDKSSFLQSSYNFVIDNYFKSNSGIFDEAVSSGKMSYIQNERLRQQIFNYYRTVKESYTDGTTRQVTDEFITPLLIESLMMNTNGFDLIATDLATIAPLDSLNLAGLQKNRDFWKMVLLKFGSNQEQIGRWGLMKEDAEKLKQEIEKEIKQI